MYFHQQVSEAIPASPKTKNKENIPLPQLMRANEKKSED